MATLEISVKRFDSSRDYYTEETNCIEFNVDKKNVDVENGIISLGRKDVIKVIKAFDQEWENVLKEQRVWGEQYNYMLQSCMPSMKRIENFVDDCKKNEYEFTYSFWEGDNVKEVILEPVFSNNIVYYPE